MPSTSTGPAVDLPEGHMFCIMPSLAVYPSVWLSCLSQANLAHGLSEGFALCTHQLGLTITQLSDHGVLQVASFLLLWACTTTIPDFSCPEQLKVCLFQH